MAETLRDLVVSLALNTDNFTRNITSVNKQIREAEMAFKAAGSGVESFEQTTSGLSLKLDTLNRSLTLQKQVIDQYEKALDASRNKLAQVMGYHADYSQRLEQARTAQANAGQAATQAAQQYQQLETALLSGNTQLAAQQAAVDAARQTYESYRATLGETDAQTRAAATALNEEIDKYNQLREAIIAGDQATVQARDTMQQTATAYQQATENVTKLEGQVSKLGLQAQSTANQVSQGNINLSNAKAKYAELENQLRNTELQLKLAENGFLQIGAKIESSNTQIAAAEAHYNLATAGIANFGASIQAAQAKVDLLNATIAQQVIQVGLYTQAVQSAKMAEEARVQQEALLSQSLEQAREKQEQMRQALDAANTVYQQLLQTQGANTDATKQAKDALDQAKAAYEAAEQDVKRLEAALEDAKQKTQAGSDAVTKANAELENAKAKLQGLRAELQGAKEDLADAKNLLLQFGEDLVTAGDSMASAGMSIMMFGHTLTNSYLGQLASGAISASMEFQDAMTTVHKTIQTDQQTYEKYAETIKELSMTYATTTTEIAEVMSNAGHLGIAPENIETFTSIMTQLGMVTGVSAATLEEYAAKFAVITGMSGDAYSNYGSALVYLSNNYAATEEEIMQMSMRLAAAGTQVGLTEQEILGFATVLSSVGVAAQAGGTAFSKVFKKMEIAVVEGIGEGNKALTDFAAVSGMTQQEFVTMWETAPAQAIQAFIIGLAHLDELGISAIGTLNDMGLTEVRLSDSVLRTANANEMMTSAMADADAAWSENTALAQASDTILQSTAKQVENLRNKFTVFKQSLGDVLAPEISNLISLGSSFIDTLSNMSDDKKIGLANISGAVLGIGSVSVVLGTVMRNVGITIKGLGGLLKVISKVAVNGFAVLAKGIIAAKTAITGFIVSSGGIGGALSAIAASPATWIVLTAAIVAAGVAIHDYTSGAKAAREALQEMNQTAREWQSTVSDNFYSNGKGLSFFGMSTDDFKIDDNGNVANAAKAWFDELVTVWTDGKGETDEIVSDWTNRFKSLTEDTRTELQTLKGAADEAGDTSLSEQLQADIKTLDSMDKEVAALLKKRQNGFLTDKEKARLQELLQIQLEIKAKYGIADDGYEGILTAVEHEVARAEAQGIPVSVDVYTNAVVAAGQGYGAVTDEIDKWYDTEYDKLDKDSVDYAEQLQKLNDEYIARRKAAALEYARTLGKVSEPILNGEDFKNQKTQVNDLIQLISRYQTETDETKKNQLFAEIGDAVNELDEGKLVEYYTLMTQIQSLMGEGLTGAEIEEALGLPEGSIDTAGIEGALKNLEALRTFAESNGSSFEALDQMLADLGTEVSEILVDLNMDRAAATWDAWAKDPGKKLTDIELNTTDENGSTPITVPAMITFSGYDVTALSDWESKYPQYANPKSTMHVGIAENSGLSLSDAFDAGLLHVYQNGMEIDVDKETIDKIDVNDLVVTNEDGTVHVIITPEVKGTKESVAEAEEGVNTDLNGNGRHIGRAYVGRSTAMERVSELQSLYRAYEMNPMPDFLGWNRKAITNNTTDYLNSDTTASLASFIAETSAALKNGEALDAGTLESYQQIMDLIGQMQSLELGDNVLAEFASSMTEALGIEVSPDQLTTMMQGLIDAGPETGAQVAEGVGKGMSEASLSGDAQTMATNTQSDVNNAFQINSPSKIMIPTGEGVAEGVGKGMTETDMSAYASALAESVLSAVQSAFGNVALTEPIVITAPVKLEPSSVDTSGVGNTDQPISMSMGVDTSGLDVTGAIMSAGAAAQSAARTAFAASNFSGIGSQMMSGLVSGINAGRSGVIAAMRSAAAAAVAAAKAALQIHSPSRVFRDEVGSMVMKGFGQGVLKETKAQQAVISNAARYLTDTARGSVVASRGGTDNRRTYNDSSSVNLSGNNFYIRSDNDVVQLSHEIASLTRRNNQLKGSI